MVPQIPIENLYYLLCYAWDVTDQLTKVKVDGEHSHSLENLLASVLTNACERLLRRGLVQEYLFREQEVEGIRGKLNLAETLKSHRYRQGKTICTIDELTNDVLINQLIYSTLKRLVRLDSLDEKVKQKVRKTASKFPHLKEVNVTARTFDRIKLNRNNRFYALVLNVCKLIWQSTLPDKNKEGRYEFIDFTEDEFCMNAVFEHFLMNFCKQHCKEEYPEAHREEINFKLTPYGMMFKEQVDEARRVLPVMETDITLFNPSTNKKHILDAKYYREALVSKYNGNKKIRREHLSQILSYVMNQENPQKPETMNADGTLVYPTVNEDFDFSYTYGDTNHHIHVRTVNLNQPWQKIEERVKEIVKLQTMLVGL